MPGPEDLPMALFRILERHEPDPAYVIDPRFTIVAWNQAALDVFGDFSALPVRDRHLLRMLFGEPLRSLIVNWEPNARFVLGTFRAATGHLVAQPWFVAFVDELSRSSEEFRAWWPDYDVELRPVRQKELAHPLVGRLTLDQTALMLDHGFDCRLIMYTPAPGTDTEAKLRLLATGRAERRAWDSNPRGAVNS